MYITDIYRRHAVGCKYEADAHSKKCGCRVWFRIEGQKNPISSGTRSWADADVKARALMNGESIAKSYTVEETITAFLAQLAQKNPLRKNRGLKVRMKQLRAFCEAKKITEMNQLTPVLLDEWRMGWKYKSAEAGSSSLGCADGHARQFFAWAFRMEMSKRNPYAMLDRYEKGHSQTMPLSPDEMTRILQTIDNVEAWGVCAKLKDRNVVAYQIRCLVVLMRYSGLSLIDAVTLSRAALAPNNSIEVRRTKTGKPVATAIPQHVAEMLRMLPSSHPGYFFWDGVKLGSSLANEYGNYLRLLFHQAGIARATSGLQGSQRFRDTFSVELLMQGVPIGDVAAAIGDTEQTTRVHYSAWIKERAERSQKIVREATAKQEPLRFTTTLVAVQ